MQLAAKMASFRRVVRRCFSYLLPLVLAVSTLSAISVVSAPVAKAALSNSDCTPSVSGLTASGFASGNDCIITFTAGTGTWTLPTGVTSVRYLVVAGGGAGGAAGYNDGSGGGGAGGVLAGTYTPAAASYTVTVGAGGSSYSGNAGGHDPTLALYQGKNSSISGASLTTISALGGGSGSSEAGNRTAANGGSGGGAGGHSGTRGTGTAGQGNDGGSTSGPGDGGGGGAGKKGGNGNSASSDGTLARAGGIGISSDITGPASYYGGGGGASGDARNASGAAGAGGQGGGGNGATASSNSSPTNGTANTGGGGGGAAGTNPVGSAKPTGAGGSGVVILRYTLSAPGAPTGLSVSTGYKQATISWTAPTSNGGSAITGYTVSSSPSVAAPAACINTASTSCVFTGLTAGTSYTFTIVATNTIGNSASSTASSSVTPFGDCGVSSTTFDGYTYLAFKNTGTCDWNVPALVGNIDYMLVAGGGGGGSRHTGGGGAGGYIKGSGVSLANVTSLNVTVGNGGTGAPGGGSGGTGANGSNSILEKGFGGGSFTTQNAVGGGGGATTATGGSSGGIYGSGTVGSATAGQGNQGAGGYPATALSVWSGGGGGGAGGTGSPGSSTAGGNGGTGTTWIAAFTSVIATSLTLTDTTGTFSGGGGGGIASNSGSESGGSGGSGGGGAGGNAVPSSNTSNAGAIGGVGVANTGGGGGGSGLGQYCDGCNPAGGNGGSGVLLIRYINTPIISLSTSTVTGTLGTAVTSYTISNTGGAASYSISPALSVAGLNFSTTTGQISGTPSAVVAPANYTITATNTSGTSTAIFSISTTYAPCSPTSSNANGFTILTFSAVTTCGWTLPEGVSSAEVLIIGGGGGGGTGGGGGGGFLSDTPTGLSGTVQIVVGSGGAGSANFSNQGGDGETSSFGDLSAGGGGGGGRASATGDGRDAPVGAQVRGSGGGATSTTDSEKSGGTGFTSGGGRNILTNTGGGGGGAGAAGFNNTTNVGKGGIGKSSSIDGSSKFYAGGGGGTNGGSGTQAGGGQGSDNAGGGGNGTAVSGATAGSGQNGVVIVRYANTYTLTYNYNSADGGNSAASNSFTTGATAITLPTPTKTNFIFDGWYEAEDLSGSALGSTYSPTQTRTIYAKWNSINADLSALVISQGTLTSAFSSSTTSYTATVSNATLTMTVTPTRSDAGATITVNGTSVVSGSPSGNISLSVGSNTITVVVTAANGTTTKSYTITVTRLASAVTPTISSQPTSASKTAGQAVTFSVTASASDSGNLSYQWKKGGTDISGATDASYTINPTATGDAGSYTVVITNSINSTTATATSNAAVLTMSSAVTITTPTTGLSGTFNTAFSLTVTASGGSGARTFAATGSLPTGVTISSGGVISGTPSIAGDFDLTVTATDANSATATTSSFRISIAKGISTISLAVGTYTYTGSPIGPDSATTTGSTGLVTYSYTGRDSTTYDPSSTKPTAVGTYTVTATLAADSNYASVSTPTTPTVDFAILNASLVITPTISASSMVFGTSSGLPTISHTKNPDVFLTTNPTCALYLASDTGFVTVQTISSTLAVGSYVVRCAGAALTNYTITYGTNPSFSVTKATQSSFSITSIAGTFGETLTLATDGGTGGGAVTFSTPTNGCSISGSDLSSTSAQTCVVTATKAADSTYEAISSLATNIVFGTRAITLTVGNPASTSFTGSAATVTNTFSVTTGSLAGSNAISGLTYTYTSVGGYNSTTAPTAVGTYTITGSSAVFSNGASSDYTITYVAGSFTISTAVLTNASAPTVSATAGVLMSIAVSWSAVSNASSYTLKLYASNGTTLLATITGLSGTSRTIIASDYGSLADNTEYQVSITAIGTGNYESSDESTKASVTTATTFTLTYSYNSATSGNGTVSDSFITGASAIALPTPSRTGYSFDGWYEASDFSGTQLSSTYSPTQSRTIYAKWVSNSLTVTFNSDGGSAVGNATVNVGVTLSAPTPPTRAGYTFSGWSATDGGAVETFPFAHGQTANFTLYAIWSANALTITYDSNGGTSVTSGSVNTGASISAAPTPPTRTGYSFDGWSATDGGTAITFPFAHGQTAGFTLYAIWAANALTVTYDSKGGTSVSNGTVNTGASITSAPTAPTKTGYTLSGWSATDGGAVVTFPYAHGQTANFTLYAIWLGNTNTVTYNSKGGSAVVDGGFITGGSISAAPTAPLRPGYTLSGWSETDGGSVISYPFSPTATAGITLYAIWSGISCSPTSSISGGYTIYTFTSAGTCFWAVPNGITDVEILAVGGGGGGGYSWDNTGAGGGGGGQVKTGTATLGATLEVTVGTGGSAGTTTSRRGGTGDSSSVSTVTALGGTGGCSARSTSCSNSAQASSSAGANGGIGGAGGASGRGGGGSNTTTAATTTTAGGAGTALSYSGSSVTYGVGGTGGAARGFGVNAAGADGTANTGNGGGGASAKNSSGNVNGGTGGSGLVIVRIASALTIRFDSQSGSPVSDGSTLTGAIMATAPTEPTRTNYTFLGWFTATTGGSAISFPYTHGRTADFTLYAQWTLDIYAIVFNANSGSGSMGNQTVTHGVALNLSANLFTRENYVFHRWATNADGTGSTYNDLVQVTLTGGTTLYAQWTANTYVVSFSYNDATGGNSTVTSSFTTGGSAILLPVPTKTGFTFAGWHSDSALSTLIGSNSGSGTYSPTGATLTLNAYAKWTAVDYTFTYNANSAGSGSVPTETSKQITQTVTVKANTGSLVRSGYTFGGWNTQSDGGGTTYLSGSLFTVGSSNVTLYAKWSANTYTVTYNNNGGTGSAQRSSSNVTSDAYTTGGSPVVLPDAGTLTRTGYTFDGWNTSAAGTGTDYAATNTYTTVSNVIFYVKWNPVTYTITYNGNSSDGGTAPTTGGYTTGQASPYVVLANSYTKTSSIFGGWNTADDRTGTNYSPGASITTLANIVLYAIWIPQFTLHYAINGGTITSGSLPADALLTQNTSVTVFSAVERTGYTFDGWTNGLTTIASGGSFNILQNSVLTAKWTAINWQISYNSDGGTTPPTSFTKQIGQSYTIGNAPTKPGHDFIGWKAGSTVVGAGATIVMGSSDITYTAQWAAQIYTISYDWNGGSGTAVSDVNYTFGTTAITLPLVGNRVKDGYTFAGWSESTNGSLLSAMYIPSQSRTLYALWNIGNFTVTYDAGRGTVANSSVPVPNGGSTTLPLPTRENFTFNGWHTGVSGGTSVGANGASFTPTASQTIYARWIQNSLYGITDSLTRIGSVVTVANVANTFSGANSNSSVAVSIPANALPAGTTINFDLVGNPTRAEGVLPGVDYLVSIALSWLTGDETVPDTASGKQISVTISNSTIKAGAVAYAIVNNVSTLLGTATQDGSITVSITSDPEIVVAAVKPDAPTNVAATSNGDQQSIVSWSAPSSDGGSAITGYTVTSSPLVSPPSGCTNTLNLSCAFTGLTTGTAYTFTVTATNNVGTSDASTSAAATTASLFAVTFDAKGGSAVTSGSFLTASTLTEPAAPTRTGYSFAGWSATDGGSAVTFPYAPGVTTDITIYARWDALDNVVTFDSKSGSDVASSVFSSGGTVTQPTAPTRSGYTFAGWSATDGGSALTFPYTPGVFTDITLYAKWSVVSSGGSSAGGGGSGGSTPAPADPTPSTPGRNNVTVVAPVTVVGDQDTKGIAVQISTPAAGTDVKPALIAIDKASAKFIAEVKVVEGKLVLTPETGFSGKKTVTVTITENGVDRIVQIPLTVLPEVVTKPVLTPTSSSRTTIRWAESPNANAYTVYLNGKKVCSTSASSCVVRKVLGPDALIEIISNGGDRTVSEKIEADFRQNNPVAITRLVSATITKATLTRVDTKALDKVIGLIRTQGFGTIVISEITTTSKTAALALARIAAIRKYIDDKTGSRKINFEVVPAASRTYFNNISVKG